MGTSINREFEQKKNEVRLWGGMMQEGLREHFNNYYVQHYDRWLNDIHINSFLAYMVLHSPRPAISIDSLVVESYMEHGTFRNLRTVRTVPEQQPQQQEQLAGGNKMPMRIHNRHTDCFIISAIHFLDSIDTLSTAIANNDYTPLAAVPDERFMIELSRILRERNGGDDRDIANLRAQLNPSE
jgi:hypothetical protein